MKHLKQLGLYSFFILMISFSRLSAQAADPLGWTKPQKVEANSVFLLWNELKGGEYTSLQKTYKYKVDGNIGPFTDTDTMIAAGQRHSDDRTTANEAEYVDVARGKFTVGPRDNAIAAWLRGTTLRTMIPVFDTTQGLWTNSTQNTLGGFNTERVFVRTGDFDGDGLDEFVILASQDTAGTNSIALFLYDVDSLLHPTLIATKYIATMLDRVMNGVHYANKYDYDDYSLATGDLNGDGRDEIVVGLNREGGNGYNMVQVFEWDGTEIIRTASKPIQTVDGPGVPDLLPGRVKIGVTCGQFLPDEKEEVVFATYREFSNINRWTYAFLLSASPDLTSLECDTLKNAERQLNGATYDPTNLYREWCVSSGDLNHDDRDELVFVLESHVFVHAVGADSEFVYKTERLSAIGDEAGDEVQSYDFLMVGDMNLDQNEDIVIARNYVGKSPVGFLISMISATHDLDSTYRIARIVGEEPTHDVDHAFAITLGNFDGGNFSIGQPTHYVETGDIQPIVMLNAPPVHFDKFDSTIYDVNDCYNGGDCDFVATYVKENTSSVEVSTVVRNDWGVEAGKSVSGEVSAEPVGIGVSTNVEWHLLGKYGKHFEKSSTNVSTLTVNVQVQAKEDDQIYSTITDYDLWEYPVYYGNEDFPRRYIMTVVPNHVEGRWFSSKTYAALRDVPDHEVGNILSYRAYASLEDNPEMNQKIRASYSGDAFTLGAATSFDWNLTRTDFTATSADTTSEIGVDFLVQTTQARFGTDYSHTGISSHKTEVTQKIDLQTHLGSINTGIGVTGYTVTPYAYWAKNGALVLDYAAKPELAPPGFPNTWWQDAYGSHSDPTFILPWKFDPEKGFAISEPAKRFQTKDISFDPVTPSPGDTVTITARIRNFSLIPTPAAVSVAFYIGDPDNGGIPLLGTGGTNVVSTIGPIPERERSDVEMKWILPGGLSSYPRIFAVLDGEGSITEIHENNNKGFNVLQVSGVTDVSDGGVGTIPQGYKLHRAFHNPFNPQTTIRYDLPRSGIVSIKVYDPVGRVVSVLTDEFQQAGTHALSFDGGGFASGVYFCRMNAGDFTETIKVMLMK
jgi:hypothetical protein